MPHMKICPCVRHGIHGQTSTYDNLSTDSIGLGQLLRDCTLLHANLQLCYKVICRDVLKAVDAPV